MSNQDSAEAETSVPVVKRCGVSDPASVASLRHATALRQPTQWANSVSFITLRCRGFSVCHLRRSTLLDCSRLIKDRAGAAALYLGKREGGELGYMGNVGTDWYPAREARCVWLSTLG